MGGLDPDDLPDPALAAEAWERVGFLVSLEVRASDAERERAALVLRDHAVAGRLTLEEFQIESRAATLVLLVFFGNADVYVPEGVEVDVDGLTVFGHRHDWGRDVPGGPDAPLVRVRIFSLFGTADVWRVPRCVSGTFRELVQAVRARQELDAG